MEPAVKRVKREEPEKKISKRRLDEIKRQKKWQKKVLSALRMVYLNMCTDALQQWDEATDALAVIRNLTAENFQAISYYLLDNSVESETAESIVRRFLSFQGHNITFIDPTWHDIMYSGKIEINSVRLDYNSENTMVLQCYSNHVIDPLRVVIDVKMDEKEKVIEKKIRKILTVKNIIENLTDVEAGYLFVINDEIEENRQNLANRGGSLTIEDLEAFNETYIDSTQARPIINDEFTPNLHLIADVLALQGFLVIVYPRPTPKGIILTALWEWDQSFMDRLSSLPNGSFVVYPL